MSNASHADDVRRVIEELIQTATSYDVEVLDRLYHRDLQVLMISEDGQLQTADKATFKAIFEAKRQAGDAPMSTWAEFHHVEADDRAGHVLLSRRNNLTGEDMFLVLSIDLVHEGGRWQVKREVIYIRPDKR